MSKKKKPGKRRNKAPRRERIALCMIVKDEEANLGRCLESVRGLVSEINIVDTGSADDTVGLAKRLGAKVREIEWNDDFSHARNISLGMADAEWILVLDADEVLAPDAIAKIKSAVRKPDIAGYMIATRNYTDDSSSGNFIPNDGAFEPASHCGGWVESLKVRLFRNRPGVCFEGVVHEVIGPSIRRSGATTPPLDVDVHHFGCLAPDGKLKNEMMARLAEKKCANRPDDYKAHYELGVIRAETGNLVEAERSLRKSISLRGDFALAHYDLGVVLSRTGREAEAAERFGAAVELDPDNVDAMNNLADSLQRLRRDDEAERVYRELLEKRPDYKRGWNNLGALLGSGGRLRDAEEAFRKALEIDPSFPDARGNLEKLRRLRPDDAGGTAGADSTNRSGRPTLGLLMIVKNERENLERMLPQLAPCFDEIVIVDTGSTDNTRVIAEKAGARVFDFAWIDDFSAARNFGLSKAGADYLLWLDADDRLDPRAVAHLRENLSDARKAFLLRVASGAGGSGEFLQLRVFPNIEGIEWEGRVHEQIFPSLERNGLSSQTLPGIVITHTGYEDQGEIREKSRRNAALLEKDRAIRPDDPYVLQHLAQAYGVLGEIDRAVEASEALINANDPATPPEFISHTMNRLVQYGLIRNDLDAATMWADRLLEAEPDNRLVRYFLGEIGYRRGQAGAAIERFEQFLSADTVIGCVPVPWKQLESNAHNFLGLLFEQTGRRDRARSQFRLAIEGQSRIEAHKNLARILLEDGSPAEAATVLQAAVEIEARDSFVWTNLGAALARSGNFDKAAEACRTALEIDPENAAARQNLQRMESRLDRSAPRSKSFTLSACIIVKNEAARLRDAIESVAPICDEIIVVDTGSMDNTRVVAKKAGARVFDFEWNDDFAAARNRSLELAQSEWIFVLDADEIIDAHGLREIAALAPEPDVWGYSITTRNYCADRSALGWRPVGSSTEQARGLPGWLPSTKVRLFRNLPEIRFEGRVHEVVEPSILKAGKRIAGFEAPVHHYGYDNTDKAKKRRYLELARLKASENPTDPRARLELGIQRMVAGDNDGAERELSEAVSLDPTSELASLNLGGVRIMLGKLKEARTTLEDALATLPKSASLHYTLGIALEKLDNHGGAEKSYFAALALEPGDSAPLAALGRLSAEKGEMRAAEDFLKRALRLDPSNESALNNLEYVRGQMAEPQRQGSNGDMNGETLQKNLENLKTLAKELAARPDDPRVIRELAETFRACGQAEHADKWMETLRSMQA